MWRCCEQDSITPMYNQKQSKLFLPSFNHMPKNFIQRNFPKGNYFHENTEFIQVYLNFLLLSFLNLFKLLSQLTFVIARQIPQKQTWIVKCWWFYQLTEPKILQFARLLMPCKLLNQIFKSNLLIFVIKAQKPFF